MGNRRTETISQFWVGLEIEDGKLKWQPGGNLTSYENFMSYYKRMGYSENGESSPIDIYSLINHRPPS